MKKKKRYIFASFIYVSRFLGVQERKSICHMCEGVFRYQKNDLTLRTGVLRGCELHR